MSSAPHERLGVYLVRVGVLVGWAASMVVTITAGHGFMPFIVAYTTCFTWLDQVPIPRLAYAFMGADLAMCLTVVSLLTGRLWTGPRQQLEVLAFFLVTIATVWGFGWRWCDSSDRSVFWFTSIPLGVCVLYCLGVAVFLTLRWRREHRD